MAENVETNFNGYLRLAYPPVAVKLELKLLSWTALVSVSKQAKSFQDESAKLSFEEPPHWVSRKERLKSFTFFERTCQQEESENSMCKLKITKSNKIFLFVSAVY